MQGKVCLVLGGGLGMGEATCRRLAKAGAKVLVNDISPERAEHVAALCREAGGNAEPVAFDALACAEADLRIAELEASHGPIDVLITIIGQAGFHWALDITPDLWELDQTRNLKYFFFHAQAVARSMKAAGRGGAITAVGSTSGIEGAPHHAAYGAAKAGLIHLVKSLAVEWAPLGIRVNAISPGAIKTPRLADPSWEERIASSLIPFKRQGMPEDIASALVYLSSDEARYISGHNLVVDGAMMAQSILGSRDDL